MNHVLIGVEIRTNHFNFRRGTEYLGKQFPRGSGDGTQTDNGRFHNHAAWLLASGSRLFVPRAEAVSWFRSAETDDNDYKQITSKH
jgi:hypothetical protein